MIFGGRHAEFEDMVKNIRRSVLWLEWQMNKISFKMKELGMLLLFDSYFPDVNHMFSNWLYILWWTIPRLKGTNAQSAKHMENIQ